MSWVFFCQKSRVMLFMAGFHIMWGNMAGSNRDYRYALINEEIKTFCRLIHEKNITDPFISLTLLPRCMYVAMATTYGSGTWLAPLYTDKTSIVYRLQPLGEDSPNLHLFF